MDSQVLINMFAPKVSVCNKQIKSLKSLLFNTK